jgi:hypothetical protein
MEYVSSKWQRKIAINIIAYTRLINWYEMIDNLLTFNWNKLDTLWCENGKPFPINIKYDSNLTRNVPIDMSECSYNFSASNAKTSHIYNA